jgi:hypothetical protein
VLTVELPLAVPERRTRSVPIEAGSRGAGARDADEEEGS